MYYAMPSDKHAVYIVISDHAFICIGPSNKINAAIKFKLSCDKQWLEVTEMNLTRPTSLTNFLNKED